MKSRTRIPAAFAVFACIGALAAPAFAADETVTLRWASFVSPMGATNRLVIPEWKEKIEAASEGTLKIEHYPGGTLGKSPLQQLSMVESGVADIAEVVVAYTPGRFPELAVFETPFLVENNLEAGLAAYKMYEKGLLSDFDDLMLVGIIISGPYGLALNEPLTGPEALEGKRIRAGGPAQTAIVEAMGATPIGNVPAPQIAENISRGLLDGALMAPANLYTFRIADAAFHHNWDVKFGSVAVIFPMRRDKYESLPPKAKAAFDEFTGEYLARKMGEAMDRLEAESKAKIRADDRQTVHEWDDATIAKVREAVAPVTAEWDKPNENGVNVYEEAQKAIEEARGSM
ncbi:TRAP transporter substrate-binding protein [Pikeienuella piscinae]|uniref:TRAP transporter substrate-binding protein n=1 Tax=Pikeienuella piscinae TaxID=2748098 RepID=A0A7M3T694_9RHOB|nr:TRAP transporter substrate-binding protein [Pikeienuella piscinae]QIE57525.1 TRAP transporter substrate-binding protein [Pikeienuella piscinae]